MKHLWLVYPTNVVNIMFDIFDGNIRKCMFRTKHLGPRETTTVGTDKEENSHKISLRQNEHASHLFMFILFAYVYSHTLIIHRLSNHINNNNNALKRVIYVHSTRACRWFCGALRRRDRLIAFFQWTMMLPSQHPSMMVLPFRLVPWSNASFASRIRNGTAWYNILVRIYICSHSIFLFRSLFSDFIIILTNNNTNESCPNGRKWNSHSARWEFHFHRSQSPFLAACS